MEKIKKSCSLEIDRFGKVKSLKTEDGHEIGDIVAGTIELRQTPIEKFSRLARVKLELFVWEDKITIVAPKTADSETIF